MNDKNAKKSSLKYSTTTKNSRKKTLFFFLQFRFKMFHPISLLLTGRKKISQKSVLNIYLTVSSLFSSLHNQAGNSVPRGSDIALSHLLSQKLTCGVCCGVAVQCVAGTCVPAGCDHSLGSSTRLGKLVFSNLMLMFSSLWLPPEASSDYKTHFIFRGGHLS